MEGSRWGPGETHKTHTPMVKATNLRLEETTAHYADGPEPRYLLTEGRGARRGDAGSRRKRGRLRNARGSQGGWFSVLADFQEPHSTLLPKCGMNQGSGTQTGISDKRRGTGAHTSSDKTMKSEVVFIPASLHLIHILYQQDPTSGWQKSRGHG